MVKIYFYLIYIVISFLLMIVSGMSLNVGGGIGIFIKISFMLFIILHLLFSFGWAYNILFKKPIKKNKNVQIFLLLIYILNSLCFNGLLLSFSFETIFHKIVISAFFISICLLTTIKLWDEIKSMN